MRSSWVAPIVGLCMALAQRPAAANGRFPSADLFVAGPGPRSDVMVVRATIGVLVSRDHGATWTWVCEESMNNAGMVDPMLAVAADGEVVSTLVDMGLSRSRARFCDWASPTRVPAERFNDITVDATGQTMVASISTYGRADGLAWSHDGGQTWTAGATRGGFFAETVDVAPSMPSRVYLTGYLTGSVPVLLRSDDGGATMREVSRAFPMDGGALIAAVDPTNPDVLYLRSNVALSTVLLRSDDGGVTLRRVIETPSPMVGFALSDDGATVWIAYNDDARHGVIRRSVRGGPFTALPAAPVVSCMRYHAGLLFVCADETVDGYTLGVSGDGGDHIDPLMRMRDLTGPDRTCPSTTTGGRLCPGLWPSTSSSLGLIDGGVDVPLVRLDIPEPDVVDAPAAVDAPDVLDASVVDATAIDASVIDALVTLDTPVSPDAVDAATGEDVAPRDDRGVADVVATVDAPVTLDVVADVVDAPSDAPSIDASVADVSPIDVTPTDVAARDAVSDAPSDQPPDGDCDCRVGRRGARSPASLAVAAIALALARRRRRAVST